MIDKNKKITKVIYVNEEERKKYKEDKKETSNKDKYKTKGE